MIQYEDMNAHRRHYLCSWRRFFFCSGVQNGPVHKMTESSGSDDKNLAHSSCTVTITVQLFYGLVLMMVAILPCQYLCVHREGVCDVDVLCSGVRCGVGAVKIVPAKARKVFALWSLALAGQWG